VLGLRVWATAGGDSRRLDQVRKVPQQIRSLPGLTWHFILSKKMYPGQAPRRPFDFGRQSAWRLDSCVF